MLSPSSANAECSTEPPATSDEHENGARHDEHGMQLVKRDVSRPSNISVDDDDGEQMTQQFQDVLNRDERDGHGFRATETASEQTASEELGEMLDHQGVGEKDSLRSDAHWMENDQSDGSGLDAGVQSDEAQADSVDARSAISGEESVTRMMTSSVPVEGTSNFTADPEGSEVTQFSTPAPSSPSLPSPSSVAVANFGAAVSHNSSPFIVPDIVSTHETDQAPVQPSQPNHEVAFSGAGAESGNLIQRCTCVDNDDCPKRDARIFTELVADAGGCLCSKSDVRDRLPRGWPDFFYPLPDLVEAQRSFESQVSALDAADDL